MGVPVFFKWLISRYPKILLETIDKDNITNVNLDIDNLYLDLNGIIHPCCHPVNIVILIINDLASTPKP